MAPAITQVAKNIPIGAIKAPALSTAQNDKLKPSDNVMAPHIKGMDLVILPLFHCRAAPTGKRHESIITIGAKTRLKKGAPTEIFSLVITSATSGQKVPTKTTKIAMEKSKLFEIIALSRLKIEKWLKERILAKRVP